MQPDNDDVPPNVGELLAKGRETFDAIESCTRNIEALAKQRQDVKQQAWGIK